MVNMQKTQWSHAKIMVAMLQLSELFDFSENINIARWARAPSLRIFRLYQRSLFLKPQHHTEHICEVIYQFIHEIRDLQSNELSA